MWRGWKFALLHVPTVPPQGLRLLYAAPIDLIQVGRVRVKLRARHEGDKVPVPRDHRRAPATIRRRTASNRRGRRAHPQDCARLQVTHIHLIPVGRIGIELRLAHERHEAPIARDRRPATALVRHRAAGDGSRRTADRHDRARSNQA